MAPPEPSAPGGLGVIACYWRVSCARQMSDRQKKAVDDNCNTEAAGRVGEPWGKFEDAGIDKVKAEPGHEVYTLTADQLAQWKKASEPLVKTWADGVKKTGVDPDTAMAELKASLAKYNALTQ